MLKELVADQPSGASDEAVCLLTVHALNLFDAFTIWVRDGRFDIATYLLRGLWDAPALVAFCSQSDADARLFMWGHDNKIAMKSRLAVVNALERSGDKDLAEVINQNYLTEYDSVQATAHLSSLHLDKLVGAEGDAKVPILFGREDAQQARIMLAPAFKCEITFLALLWSARPTIFGTTGFSRFGELHDSVAEWMDLNTI
jgi:hypothetical protein